MLPLTIRYAFRPLRRSLATGQVADLFGLGDDPPEHTIADRLDLDVRPGDLVLFTGPSGSGKSSLLREVGRRLGAVDAMSLELPDVPLVDALGGPVEERLKLLAACGLSEARLMLRTPTELSDGQRYRFRLAYALESINRRVDGIENNGFLLADEFAAHLDRTLARVLAFNVRKLATRTGVGALLATTHEDLTADLRPDLHVRCLGDGDVRATRDPAARQPRPISFAGELRVEGGSRRDWPAFAKWHYRSHHPGFVRRVVLLKHGPEPIGICVFAAPAAALAPRSRYFGLSGRRSRLALDALNAQLWVLARLVLHPTYRGAGIAADFVREACRTCPVPWIEALSALGHANPVFERAGFVRAGSVTKSGTPDTGGQFARRPQRRPTDRARYSEPAYFVFDNRDAAPEAGERG